ncbi:hypothetical protein C8R45DRAFT_1110807 [Mycena sanguinolenta]|nr:hypothetical protein C8R45DRAFT_1110807 [Mycena sanguinolenta]
MLYKFALLTLLVSTAGFAAGAPIQSQRRDVDSDIDDAIAAALQEAEGLATQAINAGVETFSLNLATTLVEPAAAPTPAA